MRPVERGAAPREYARYGDAIGDLEERLGKYCSYCERRLPIGLAVEHMAPKNPHRERDRNRELDWYNFLLGCTNCNSVKGDTEVADDDVLWPDRHNTMLAFSSRCCEILCGLFSVWFAIFDEHVDVRLALIDAFPGTATSCFDQDGSLVNRPGAEI